MFAGLVAAAGYVQDDGAAADDTKPTAWLWPCNVGAWGHWVEVQTQWQHGGMGGATGLNYAGVVAYLREAIEKRKPRAQVFEGIRAAERATLDVWAQQREDRKRD